MERNMSMVILVLLLSFCSQFVNSTELDSLNKPAESTTNDLKVFIGGYYGSNYLYYGRSISENKPYYSTNLTLMHKSGFWTSGSAFHLFNEVPYINFYDLSVGWQNSFNSRFDGGITYTRFIFPQANNDGSAMGFSFWTFQAGFDWNLLYTTVGSSFLTGDNIDFYLIVKNSRYFQSKFFAKDKMYFSFDPSFTFVSGSRDYYKVTQIKRRFGVWPGTILVEEERRFQILDFELSFPVAFNWGKFTFEPAVTYYHPVNLTNNDLSKEGFYLYFSLFVSI